MRLNLEKIFLQSFGRCISLDETTTTIFVESSPIPMPPSSTPSTEMDLLTVVLKKIRERKPIGKF